MYLIIPNGTWWAQCDVVVLKYFMLSWLAVWIEALFAYQTSLIFLFKLLPARAAGFHHSTPAAWELSNLSVICEALKTSGPPWPRSSVPLVASWCRQNATITSQPLWSKCALAKCPIWPHWPLLPCFSWWQALSDVISTLVWGGYKEQGWGAFPVLAPFFPNNMCVSLVWFG